MMVSFVLSFFPRGVLNEILNLIESVSEGFPSYSCIINCSFSFMENLWLTNVLGMYTVLRQALYGDIIFVSYRHNFLVFFSSLASMAINNKSTASGAI